ncbi:MAG: tripartite tricarboxylate transporter substrate binding protein [Chloroflexi bacterium]|nr:tripartite tricarboxylate transporter substrate binding protein [Chloroflexota bacterium]
MLSRSGIAHLVLVLGIAALMLALAACTAPAPTPVPPTSAPVVQPTTAPATGPTAAATTAATKAAATTAPTTASTTQDLTAEATFYKGKTVDFIVPYATGGGYDQWARVLAPTLSRLTGATFVVKNVPGAGSVVGTNQLFAADPNGLTMGILNGAGVMQAQLTDAAGVQYDLAKFTWLGRITTDPRVITVGAKGKYQSIDAMRTTTDKVKFGAPGIGSSNFVEAALIISALGIKNADLVTGYDTSEEADLATIRGEIDATPGSYASKLPQIQSGDLKVILQYGASKNPGLPSSVPMLTELPNVNAQGQQMIKIALALGELGRPLAGPPGMSPTRAAYLEKVIKQALEDPETVALAKKQTLDVLYMSAAEMTKLVKDGMNLSPDQKKVLKDTLAKYQPSK